jgi:hypothetical protein
MPFFERPYLKKIPLGIAVTQYLGFLPAVALAQARQAGAPLSFWESATQSLNLKYWVTSPSQYRYGLEKWGVTSHRRKAV